MKRRSFKDVIDPVSAHSVEHPTRTGAIVLLVALLVIVGVVTQSIPFLYGESGHTIRADFAKVNNINARTPVRVRGVDVGTVTGIAAGPDPQRSSELKMLITNSGVVVHSDATAAIRWRTVLGGPMYVDLNPGSPDAPKLAGAIPVSRTSSQDELDDLFRVYNGSTDQAQRDMLKGLSETLAAPGGLHISLRALPDLRTVGAGLTPYMGTEQGDLARVVRGTARTAQALGASTAKLQTLVQGARQTLGATYAQRDALGQTMQLSPPTLDSTLTTMERLRTTLDHLDPLVSKLEPGATQLAPAAAALAPALNRTNAVLEQARPLLKSARPAFSDLRAASRLGTPLLQGLQAPVDRLNSNILPWLGRRDSDTKLLNYEAIGPFFSVLDKAGAEFDSSGYRLHLSTLLGSASVIDQATFASAKSTLSSQCRQAANRTQRRNCNAVTQVVLGALYGGTK
jgi:phospholipid/cholesterol/gamma-HCH transport system substrate-binding protein